MPIRKLLELSKLTQVQLADKVGATQPQISEYINGKKNISLARLQKWCKILNIDIKEIV